MKAILIHVRDEKKEPAARVFEWIRRCDNVLDKNVNDFLLTDALIAHKQSLPSSPCLMLKLRCCA